MLAIYRSANCIIEAGAKAVGAIPQSCMLTLFPRGVFYLYNHCFTSLSLQLRMVESPFLGGESYFSVLALTRAAAVNSFYVEQRRHGGLPRFVNYIPIITDLISISKLPRL